MNIKKVINEEIEKLTEDYPFANSESGNHRFSRMVDPNSPEITDDELNQIESKILPYLDDEKFEYRGNYILTKSEEGISSAMQDMCCGIVNQEFVLNDGSKIYFAFDYGH